MKTHPPVVVREVGPRDGLQILPRVLPTMHKLDWLRAAHDAGLREIEVGSFVPARLMPQLADTAELVTFAKGARAATWRRKTWPTCSPGACRPAWTSRS